MSDVKIHKKWKLSEISDIIVKCYSLIRQAFEIYFKDYSSVFISLYDPKYLKMFLNNLKSFVNEKQPIEIAEDPAEYFKSKGFAEQWANDKISNFEYLMLLNKYG